MKLLDRIRPFKTVNLSHFVPLYVGTERVGWTKKDFARDLAACGPAWVLKNDALHLEDGLKTLDDRTRAIDETFQEMVSQGIIKQSPYYPDRDDWYGAGKNRLISPLFHVRRAYSSYLGIRVDAINVNGYENDRLWVAKRSPKLLDDPGKYDSMVCGAAQTKLSLLENVALEAREEASMPDEWIKKIRPIGVISAMYHLEDGFFFNEDIYTYQLDTKGQFIPKPHIPDEIDSFHLMPMDEVIHIITNTDLIKPNIILNMADFLIKNGYIRPEETGYTELAYTLWREHPLGCDL